MFHRFVERSPLGFISLYVALSGFILSHFRVGIGFHPRQALSLHPLYLIFIAAKTYFDVKVFHMFLFERFPLGLIIRYLAVSGFILSSCGNCENCVIALLSTAGGLNSVDARFIMRYSYKAICPTLLPQYGAPRSTEAFGNSYLMLFSMPPETFQFFFVDVSCFLRVPSRQEGDDDESGVPR